MKFEDLKLGDIVYCKFNSALDGGLYQHKSKLVVRNLRETRESEPKPTLGFYIYRGYFVTSETFDNYKDKFNLLPFDNLEIHTIM